MKRAVITGLGTVSGIGNNQQEVLASLRKGRSGAAFSQGLKGSGTRSHVWGNAKLDTTGLTDCKAVCFMSDAFIYALPSMEQAIADAGLPPEAYQNNPRVGLITGSGGGSPRFQVSDADAVRDPRGPKTVGPYTATKAMAFGVSAYLVAPFKIHGVSYSVNSACATSAHCISNAVERVQLSKQDIVFAGGSEELRWETTCEFGVIGALSVKHNDTPEKASRTYDAHRDGFVTVSGGGMVVVEELEHVLACGAHIYAEIVGYGAIPDSADMVTPSGEGTVRCMKTTTRDVNTPINYLNSHDTSTLTGDVKELAVIHEVLGDKSSAISTVKTATSHSLGAADVQGAIYSLLIPEHDFIVPSINIKESDEQTAGLNIVTETTDCKLTVVMSDSFGLGGTSATLVMRRLKG